MGKQAPHLGHAPLQRDEPGPTLTPPGHGGPHSELVAWLSFFQKQLQSQARDPGIGCRGAHLLCPLSHQCPEQVGA